MNTLTTLPRLRRLVGRALGLAGFGLLFAAIPVGAQEADWIVDVPVAVDTISASHALLTTDQNPGAHSIVPVCASFVRVDEPLPVGTSIRYTPIVVEVVEELNDGLVPPTVPVASALGPSCTLEHGFIVNFARSEQDRLMPSSNESSIDIAVKLEPGRYHVAIEAWDNHFTGWRPSGDEWAAVVQPTQTNERFRVIGTAGGEVIFRTRSTQDLRDRTIRRTEGAIVVNPALADRPFEVETGNSTSDTAHALQQDNPAPTTTATPAAPASSAVVAPATTAKPTTTAQPAVTAEPPATAKPATTARPVTTAKPATTAAPASTARATTVQATAASSTAIAPSRAPSTSVAPPVEESAAIVVVVPTSAPAAQAIATTVGSASTVAPPTTAQTSNAGQSTEASDAGTATDLSTSTVAVASLASPDGEDGSAAATIPGSPDGPQTTVDAGAAATTSTSSEASSTSAATDFAATTIAPEDRAPTTAPRTSDEDVYGEEFAYNLYERGLETGDPRSTPLAPGLGISMLLGLIGGTSLVGGGAIAFRLVTSSAARPD